MRDLSLSDEIKTYFPNHDEHVIKNLLVVSWSIFDSKSTNLNKAKDSVPGILGNGALVEESSNYARLIRFFKIQDQEELVACILTVCCVFLKPNRGGGFKHLILDGTEWELGSQPVQLLTLCILWRGVAVPIWWEDIEKIGHSSQDERKSLIMKALERYKLRGMILLADREYIGEEWFGFLRGQGIDFVIRLKANIYHGQVNACPGPRQSNLKRKAATKKPGGWADKKILWNGEAYRYIIAKNLKTDPQEPLVYLLTSLPKAQRALSAYCLRWRIETCFKHLKTNGFNLEEMNVKGKNKRNLMMAVVVFLYVCAVVEGYFAIEKVKNRKKTYKYFKKSGITTLAVSFFRKGISLLHRKIDNFKELLGWLTEILMANVKPNWAHV
jgi:Transposase DDE domain